MDYYNQEEKDKKLPRKLLKEKETDRMIEAIKNPREPALIAVLWETEARPGELLAMRIRDFEDRKHGKKVVIEGKTGRPEVTSNQRRPVTFHLVERAPGT